MAESKKISPMGAATVLTKAVQEKIAIFEKELRELRKRELKKSLIPPHKHTTGSSAGGGVEDVAPGKLEKVTPPGISEEMMHKLKAQYGGDKEKAYATAWKIHNENKTTKAECKCGKEHVGKACGMEKAILSDSKGNVLDNGINPESVLPGDVKSQKIGTDSGSGGSVRSLKMLHKNAMSSVQPPTAKPPSGKNPIALPISKPATIKAELEKEKPKLPKTHTIHHGMAGGYEPQGMIDSGVQLIEPSSAPPIKPFIPKTQSRPGIFGRLYHRRNQVKN